MLCASCLRSDTSPKQLCQWENGLKVVRNFQDIMQSDSNVFFVFRKCHPLVLGYLSARTSWILGEPQKNRLYRMKYDGIDVAWPALHSFSVGGSTANTGSHANKNLVLLSHCTWPQASHSRNWNLSPIEKWASGTISSDKPFFGCRSMKEKSSGTCHGLSWAP